MNDLMNYNIVYYTLSLRTFILSAKILIYQRSILNSLSVGLKVIWVVDSILTDILPGEGGFLNLKTRHIMWSPGHSSAQTQSGAKTAISNFDDHLLCNLEYQ